MKATGIVRRIDDLGRVVIPKEIRRTLRIREGDPLEIFTDTDGEVVFKKYSPVGEMSLSGRRAFHVCLPVCGGAEQNGKPADARLRPRPRRGGGGRVEKGIP